jgi:glycosyltransferase involved in cell wall biosynthesis
MTDKPLVSVIIPCYNSGKTLDRTLNSIFEQSWSRIEIILVNDGSSDELTLQKLESVLKLTNVTVINQQNLGLSAARNTGINNATGEFVLPLDSDDWLDNRAIQIMVEAALSMNSSAVIYSDIQVEGVKSRKKQTFNNYFEQLFSNQLPYCMLIPIKIFQTNGLYDVSLRNGLEDWEFNIRLFVNGVRYLKISEPLFHYNINQNGMFIQDTLMVYTQILMKIRIKYPEIYKLRSLIKIWSLCKHQSSKRYLPKYFIVNLLVITLPAGAYNFLFKSLLLIVRKTGK